MTDAELAFALAFYQTGPMAPEVNAVCMDVLGREMLRRFEVAASDPDDGAIPPPPLDVPPIRVH